MTVSDAEDTQMHEHDNGKGALKKEILYVVSRRSQFQDHWIHLNDTDYKHNGLNFFFFLALRI